MQYAILCYNEEDVVLSMSKEDDQAMMARLNVVQDRLVKSGKLGVSLRLLPTTAAATLRKAQNGEALGPKRKSNARFLHRHHGKPGRGTEHHT